MIEITYEIDGKTYFIEKMDCITARRVAYTYFSSAIPKLGNYDDNEKMMYELFKFVKIELSPGNKVALATPDLIKNHVKSMESLIKIEDQVFRHNYDFFQNGIWSGFLEAISQTLSHLNIGTLMGSLQPSSIAD